MNASEKPISAAEVIADALQDAYGGADGDEMAIDYWGEGAEKATAALIEFGFLPANANPSRRPR